jgi:hypothetical protein
MVELLSYKLRIWLFLCFLALSKGLGTKVSPDLLNQPLSDVPKGGYELLKALKLLPEHPERIIYYSDSLNIHEHIELLRSH